MDCRVTARRYTGMMVAAPADMDAHGALALIGKTPLIELARIHRGPGRLFAKAEFMQPGGSVKDRAALWAVRSALADGRLQPGQRVIEMTSGNMGAGLAVVCAALGHPFTAVMSAGNSKARRRMLLALGADLVLVPQVEGTPGRVTGADIAAADREARALAVAKNMFLVDQFANPDCVTAHREGTGPEIWAQMGGHFDGFVAAVGSGATFVGVAQFLKSQDRRIGCYAVEPSLSRPLAGQAVAAPRHLLQGTGYGRPPPQWQPELMDEGLAVDDATARRWRRRLATEEGLHVGYSAAANVAAASALLDSGALGEGGRAVTILCDTGLKY